MLIANCIPQGAYFLSNSLYSNVRKYIIEVELELVIKLISFSRTIIELQNALLVLTSY